MNNKLYLVVILFFAFNSNVKAQRTCSSYEHYQHMLQTNPEFATQRQLIETHTRTLAEQTTKSTRALKTIPVVVHVVYNTAAQNISDAQINSQITALNQDFRKLNIDFSNTPSVFQALGADCQIEFCLAQQTPSGVATNGIVRVSTSVTSFIDDDAVKFTAQGGDNAWDATKYLNIWVCPLGGGLLGYAQFPGGPASTDGVVIRHQSFGTTGTVTAPYHKGRTATHEIGHWLNLFHIWGDDGTLCTGSDLVSDTPNQADENYGCPTFPTVSCSNSPNGDLFMNYMDYTNDDCMTLFTNGQSTRMNALFATGGTRVSLLTSNGCQLPAACGMPTSLSATSITSSSATLTWSAVSSATSYTIQYKLTSASTWTSVSSSTNSKAISGLTANSSYQFQVQATCAAGNSNYSSTASFTTLANSPACSNNYEPNNSRPTAASIAINTSIQSMLATSTDKDYFKVTTTTAAPKLNVTLTNLPADYELKLYNAAGTLLGSSLKVGTTAEQIKYNNASVGQTYTIYVYGYNAAYNASQCYTLTTQTSASNFKMDPSAIEEKLDFKISPNPTNSKIEIQYMANDNEQTQVCVYSMLGQRMMNASFQNQIGENTVYLDLQALSAGVYLLEISHGDERQTERISLVK